MGRHRTLSDSDIRHAFKMRSMGKSLSLIASELFVSRQYVAMILSRKAYGDVKVPAIILDTAAQHLPTEAIKRAVRDGAILAAYQAGGRTQKEIAVSFGISVSTVARVIK